MITVENVSILLVEDNPRDIELAVDALRSHNLANDVCVIQDGDEALEFLLARGMYAGRDIRNVPKVVFLDLKLPGTDGLEILRELRTEERTRMIPVVVMTSSQEERDLVESYKLGANSYVVKPLSFPEFSKVVANLGFYWLLINKSPADVGRSHTG
jgi:two-component system response regulator